MDEGGWEHFEHEADIGVRGWGPSPARAFEQAALAMTAVVTDPAAVGERESVPLACAAPDLDVLFVDWLNAIVFEMATRRMLFARFQAEIVPGPAGHALHGRAWGEPADPARHQPAVEVKGATFTALAVEQDPDGQWRAECVVDV